MSNISVNAYCAFKEGKKFSSGNTKVIIEEGEPHMYLYDREIVKRDLGCIWISDGGYYPTKTTQSRLREFIRIRINKDVFIVDEQLEWDGHWLNIDDLQSRS